MGDFVAKIYNATNPIYITHFRTSFYKYLESFLGKSTRRYIKTASKGYYVYSYRGKDLIAIPEYYHGKGVWTPHLSLIKLDKIQRSNPNLYNAYEKSGVSALIRALAGSRGSLDHFNMSRHFNIFEISVV